MENLEYVLKFALQVIEDNELENTKNSDNWVIGEAIEEHLKTLKQIKMSKTIDEYTDNIMKTPIEMLNAIIEMQKENYGHGTATHLELIDLVEEAESVVKNCSIPDVSERAFKSGDTVEIIGNSNNHGFVLGEKVVLDYFDDYEWFTEGPEPCWWLNEIDIKL